MRKVSLIAGVASLAVLAGGVAAWSAIPNSTTGTITGCYSKSSGTLRVIDKQIGKKCRSTERELTWAQAGPAGNGGGTDFHVRDAADHDLGVLVSGPPSDESPEPGAPDEYSPTRAVVVRRADGTFAAYDASTGSVPRHGTLYYFSTNCTGTAYLRLDELSTFFTFYGIPPLEVNAAGQTVRAVTATGASVEPTEGHALKSLHDIGETGCTDLSDLPLFGAEFTVKQAAAAAYTPADADGPLRISTT